MSTNNYLSRVWYCGIVVLKCLLGGGLVVGHSWMVDGKYGDYPAYVRAEAKGDTRKSFLYVNVAMTFRFAAVSYFRRTFNGFETT